MSSREIMLSQVVSYNGESFKICEWCSEICSNMFYAEHINKLSCINARNIRCVNRIKNEIKECEIDIKVAYAFIELNKIKLLNLQQQIHD